MLARDRIPVDILSSARRAGRPTPPQWYVGDRRDDDLPRRKTIADLDQEVLVAEQARLKAKE